MAIGEAIISAWSTSFVSLFRKLSSPLISEVGKLHSVEDELEKLKRTLRRLEALLRDAERRKAEGELFALCLRELRGVARDAEDVVDELEYEHLRLQAVENGGGGSGSGSGKAEVSRQLPSSSNSPHTVLFREEMSRRIEGIRVRLDEISKDMRDLGMGGVLGVGQDQPGSERKMRETSSFLVDLEVLGRDEVKNKLMRLLIGTTGDGSVSLGFSVLSIVGMGGLGKTTMAQWIYNSKDVQEHFHIRIWLCVSHDFNLKRLTKQMLEHVVDPQSGVHSINNLNVLQQHLLRRLKGKRFLLILDDVWEEGNTNWTEFCAPLLHGEKGSKVLVTTRNGHVADMVRSVKIELEGLSFDDCWSIFKKHAFCDGNSDKFLKLEPIGKEIVKKLKGVPLAVATIGGLLRTESEEREWKNILQNDLWELEVGEGIFSALRVSYEYLPLHLKQCFAYCSVFPKGCRFDMLELVQHWLAHGYIQPMGRKSVEDVGRSYFNELFNRSLIQFVNGKYAIHDLLHDLGQLILQHDCYQMRPEQLQKIPEGAHCKLHLTLYYGKSLEGDWGILQKFSSLRTLSFWFSGFPYIHVPLDLFHAVKCLRVLDLSCSSLDTLPNSIGCLKHLRYIDLRRTKLKCLPDSFCTLYNLQTLKLEGCNELNILPNGLNNLINLHYLEARHELVSNITRLGKLTNLQNLEVFFVSEENENRIVDLKNMDELHGKLCIQNLQTVVIKEEGIDATLENKQHLETLEMEWADDQDANPIDNQCDSSVIDSLRPPPHLKELIIKSYTGINYPSWMENGSMSSLETFQLYKCINLNSVPPLTWMHSLRTLAITKCPELKELPHLPTALRNLILKHVGLNVLPNNLHTLPLQQFIICQVSYLREMPLLPVTLNELTIEGVGLQVLPEFCQDYDFSVATLGAVEECESSSNREPALSLLKIHGCPHLTHLHEGLLKCHLWHLQVLSIKDCEKLTHWPEGEGFQATLRSLEKEFSIESCPKLKALPEGSELHPSLKKLIVKASPGIPTKTLFSQMHNFRSDNIFVKKWYHNLADCVDEALGSILTVDWLNIKYISEGDGLFTAADCEESPPPSSPLVSFVCNRKNAWSWKHKNYFRSQQVSLVIKERKIRACQTVGDADDDVSVDDDSSNLFCKCIGDHTWVSSLRALKLHGIPDRAFIGVHPHDAHGPKGGDLGSDAEALLRHPLHLPLLETLVIWGCREMTRLPTKTLLSHLMALKELAISDCPELTLLSLEAGIQSVPSLVQLFMTRCPKLLTLPLSSLNISDNDEALSEATLLPLSPPSPLLQYLSVDDSRLLTLLLANSSHHGPGTSRDYGRFFSGHLLNSLRQLCIFRSEITALTAEEEEGLRTLACSLQCLRFEDCSILQSLPMDLRGLLPNLKLLEIVKCPNILCLQHVGLPSSLEVMYIKGCPKLAEWCRLRVRATPLSTRGMQDDDWHDMALLPVIVMDGVILQGSYSRYLEFKAKWNFRL